MDVGDDDFAERLRVAYHEAGHAVVGMRFGIEVDRVKINPDGSGYYRPTSVSGVSPNLGREYALRLLAGRLAEEFATGEPREAADDWLRHVLTRLRSGDPEIADYDDAKVLSMFIEGADSDDLAVEEYRALEEETTRLLAEAAIRTCIEAVALALVRRRDGEMGFEAMMIADDAEEEDAPSEGAIRRREFDRLERIAVLAGLGEDERNDRQPPADENEPM